MWPGLYSPGHAGWSSGSIRCGARMEENRRRCSQCGKTIPFDANVCPYCGKTFGVS
ncbi:MAG: zinc ribbon domain-containing protein [Thermoplasmatota archaeon]